MLNWYDEFSNAFHFGKPEHCVLGFERTQKKHSGNGDSGRLEGVSRARELGRKRARQMPLSSCFYRREGGSTEPGPDDLQILISNYLKEKYDVGLQECCFETINGQCGSAGCASLDWIRTSGLTVSRRVSWVVPRFCFSLFKRAPFLSGDMPLSPLVSSRYLCLLPSYWIIKQKSLITNQFFLAQP